MPGDTSLIAEAKLNLSGFREGADGSSLVENVTHTLDGGGHAVSIQGGVAD